MISDTGAAMRMSHDHLLASMRKLWTALDEDQKLEAVKVAVDYAVVLGFPLEDRSFMQGVVHGHVHYVDQVLSSEGITDDHKSALIALFVGLLAIAEQLNVRMENP